jgi:hypothetical protein
MPFVFMSNGYNDIYPHSDFEGPCTCAECCMDIQNGYYPTCGVCERPLRQHGLCKECVESSDPSIAEKAKKYMEEN